MSIPSEDLLLFNDRQPEEDELDYEFRIVLLTQKFNHSNPSSEINVDQSEIEERILSNIQSFTSINQFFDKFDSEIAYPNENFVKYDVGSDGMIVIVVDNDELKEKVLNFVDEYLKTVTPTVSQQVNEEEDEVEDEVEVEQRGNAKKQRK